MRCAAARITLQSIASPTTPIHMRPLVRLSTAARMRGANALEPNQPPPPHPFSRARLTQPGTSTCSRKSRQSCTHAFSPQGSAQATNHGIRQQTTLLNSKHIQLLRLMVQCWPEGTPEQFRPFFLLSQSSLSSAGSRITNLRRSLIEIRPTRGVFSSHSAQDRPWRFQRDEAHLRLRWPGRRCCCDILDVLDGEDGKEEEEAAACG